MEWCNYMKPVTPMQDLAKCICTSPFGTLSLTTYEQDQMKMKYRCKYDQYDKLCLAWEADRKKAVRERRTRTFPKNMETWSNSREAGELVPTFEDEITKYKHWKKADESTGRETIMLAAQLQKAVTLPLWQPLPFQQGLAVSSYFLHIDTFKLMFGSESTGSLMNRRTQKQVCGGPVTSQTNNH